MEYNINSDNWNYCYYENKDLKAMISLSLDPEHQVGAEYFTVSVLDNEHKDLYQKDFSKIDAACQYLNSKYQNIWELISLQKSSDSSGCSTCVAH